MTATEEDIDDLYEQIYIIDRDIKRYENEILTTTPEDCKKHEMCIKNLKCLNKSRNDYIKIIEMIYKKTEFGSF